MMAILGTIFIFYEKVSSCSQKSTFWSSTCISVTVKDKAHKGKDTFIFSIIFSNLGGFMAEQANAYFWHSTHVSE